MVMGYKFLSFCFLWIIGTVVVGDKARSLDCAPDGCGLVITLGGGQWRYTGINAVGSRVIRGTKGR